MKGIEQESKMDLNGQGHSVHTDGKGVLTVTAGIDYKTSSCPLMAGTASDLYVTPVRLRHNGQSKRRNFHIDTAIFCPLSRPCGFVAECAGVMILLL